MATIYRGTTPTITVKLNSDFDLNEINALMLSISSQGNKYTFEKDNTILNNETKTISKQLSQEETLALYGGIALLQLRIRLNNGIAYASDVIPFDVRDILEEGVI